MKRYSIVLYLTLLIPFLANGYHAFVWNFDTLDVFYDSQVGDTIDCSYWLEQSLSANGHTYVTGINLPVNLNPYDVVIVTLGLFRC